jgi:hypothetical protein
MLSPSSLMIRDTWSALMRCTACSLKFTCCATVECLGHGSIIRAVLRRVRRRLASSKAYPPTATFEGLFWDGKTEGSRTGIWRKLMPHGTAVVEPIHEALGWHSYAFKNVWQCDDTDRVVFLPLPVAPPVPLI